MTALESADAAAWLRQQAGEGNPDVLRTMITVFANALMAAEADAAFDAEYGQRSDDRVNRRNGYRPREWDTRASTVELAIPKLRTARTSRNGCSNTAAVRNRRWFRRGDQLPARGVEPAGGEAG